MPFVLRGKSGNLAEAHLWGMSKLVSNPVLGIIYQIDGEVLDHCAAGRTLDDDAALKGRDGKLDLCKTQFTPRKVMGDSNLCHPLSPRLEESAQLSDGSLFDQVPGDKEGILEVVDV